MPGGLFSNDLLVYIGYGLLGLSVFLTARMLLQEEESRAAEENLSSRTQKSSNPLVAVTKPFFTRYFLPMVRGKNKWDKQRLIYKRKIISGGIKDEFTPDEFIAFKIFLILFFPVVGTALKIGDFLDLEVWQILASGAVGWFYPDLWVGSRIKSRQKEVRRAMPFIVDLLALSTEAGLDFVGAIGKVVEKAKPSPLVLEFEQFLKEIKIGSSRAEALREMAIRIDMTEISSFVAILISADQMGASIGKILRQQSDQIRTQRFVAAEKAGAAASQKILIPLVFLILPAVMLMIFGPFFIEFFSGG